MKTIKFRAWNSYENKMYEWDEICKMDEKGHLTLTNLLNNFINHVKPIQFTGLQDKNGKDIYEGDIVHFKGTKSDEATAIVEFKDGRFIFMIDAKAILYKDIMGWRDTEIIGNIHENPELILHYDK